MANENNANVQYVTNFLYENNGAVYGMEVLIYNDGDDVISKLLVVNKSEFDSWTTMVESLTDAFPPYTTTDLENLDRIREYKAEYDDGDIDWDTYQSRVDSLVKSDLKEIGSLEDILKNEVKVDTNTGVSSYPVEINATKFMGLNSDEFSKKSHTHNYAPKIHSTNTTDYGVGTGEVYGHNKVIDNLSSPSFVSGESLSAYQGKILNDKITNVENKNAWSNFNQVNAYLKYKVNEDLRLVVCQYSRENYTGLASKTGNQVLHGAGTIPSPYAPSGRVLTPMYRGDVVMYFKTDGSVNIYNLTKIKQMNLYCQVMWHY